MEGPPHVLEERFLAESVSVIGVSRQGIGVNLENGGSCNL